MGPSRETSSPDSPMDSKPSSPSSPRSGPTTLQPTLERLLDSPVTTTAPTVASPATSEKSGPASPAEAEKPSASEDAKAKNGNALAALAAFCNDQKKNPKAGTGDGKEVSAGEMSDPGAILAFSWACNQAVSADSAIKCPFCDTPFISKGAYRHHLSKMHFTKENLGSLAGNQTLGGAVGGAVPSA